MIDEIENKPFFLDSILHGDALEKLQLLPDNCIDALVCDPPAGISFMNREFDSDKGGRDKWINWLCTIMKEVYRVLKPGSYGLIWSLPRTSHWTATALENAGFEIRDSISHLYAPDSKIASFYSTLSQEQLNLFEQVLDSADTSFIVEHIFGCLSEDTEILTANGWVHYQNCVENSLALCYNINTKKLGYEPIQEVLIYDYNDTAYSIKSDFTDQIVSRNHRCIVERNGKEIFEFAENLRKTENFPIVENLQSLQTSFLTRSNSRIKKNNMLNRMQQKWKRNFRKKISPIQNRFLFSVRQRISYIKYAIKKVLLRNMLWNLESKRSKLKSTFKTNSFKWKKRMDTRKLLILLRKYEWRKKSSMERWGNNIQKTRKLYRSSLYPLSKTISTNGKERWIHNGTSVNSGTTLATIAIENRSSTPQKSYSYRQQIREFDALQEQSRTQTIRTSRFTSSTMATVTPIHYEGKVWCIRVPSGAFVARRNGKIFITGNSGFPKSQNISKEIEKKFGITREIIGISPNARNAHKLGGMAFDKAVGKEEHSTIYETKPSEELESKYAGLGSNLKPSVEQWILVRKPLSEKTLADNVLKWGTGGLSIDASRIPTTDKWTATGKQSDISTSLQGGVDGSLNISVSSTHENGRWPSHLLISHHENCILEGTKKIKPNGGQHLKESNKSKFGINTYGNNLYNQIEEIENWHCVENVCPVWILNQQSGERGNSARPNSKGKEYSSKAEIYGKYNPNKHNSTHNDTGGASRFFQTFPPYFYAAKASKSERNAGCEDLEEKESGGMKGTENKSLKTGSGNERNNLNRNTHPTVKNLKLMSYLIKLITPENGIVLDCFAGSGSTLVAAIQCEKHFIGIEKETEYIEIARARIEFSLNKQQLDTN